MSQEDDFLAHTRFGGLKVESLSFFEIHPIGAHLFNEGFYHEAHEAWEAIWQEDGGPYRDFFQALILFSGALYHWRNENIGGMSRLAQMGLKKSEPFPEVLFGVQLKKLRQEISLFISQAEKSAEPSRLDPPLLAGEVLDWKIPSPKE